MPGTGPQQFVKKHLSGHFGRGSFRPGHFGLGCFGLILGWVTVSAYIGGSFQPDIPPIFNNINEVAHNYRVSFMQGGAENSIPDIYRWNLPVFPGMANKAQVANTGKYNFFAAKYWQI